MENKVDPVHPSHYKLGGIEAVIFIESNGLNFNMGNVVKYVTRYKYKGTPLVDLKKARYYLDREIDKLKQSESRGGYDAPAVDLIYE